MPNVIECIISVDPEKLLLHSYRDIIIAIYNAIPYHPVAGLEKSEVSKIITDYANLYHYLSNVHAHLMSHYSGKVNDKFKLLKGSIDQALTVIKFQYETLSRRFTIDKDEQKFWSKTA